MKKQTAKTWVKVFSVLNYVGGGFAILLGFLFFFAVGFSAEIAQEVGLSESLISAIIAGVIVLFIALGAIGILIGWGLWTYRSWARILVLVFAGIGVLGNLFGFIPTGDQGTAYFFSALMSLVGIGIAAVQIWLFGFEKDVVKLFR